MHFMRIKTRVKKNCQKKDLHMLNDFNWDMTKFFLNNEISLKVKEIYYNYTGCGTGL